MNYKIGDQVKSKVTGAEFKVTCIQDRLNEILIDLSRGDSYSTQRMTISEESFLRTFEALSKKPMTVRQAFSLAFGPVPEGATCHFAGGCIESETLVTSEPVLIHSAGVKVSNAFGDRWNKHFWRKLPANVWVSPDISDRPAEAFLGFFGDRYDAVVRGEL